MVEFNRQNVIVFFACSFLILIIWTFAEDIVIFARKPSQLLRVGTQKTSFTAPASTWHCLTTSNGVCLTEAFAAMDTIDQANHQWPTVDVVVRAAANPTTLAVMQYLFRSLELFWPKNVGEIIAVFDDADSATARLQVPPYVTVRFETVLPELIPVGGRFYNQWSQFWADNYSTADYVLYIDSDSMLSTKVTYDLLFRDTPEGRKSILIGSRNYQKGTWTAGTEWLLRKPELANFMDELPMVFPRDVLPRLREYVLSQHPDCRTFDECIIAFARLPTATVEKFVSYGVMGNFMLHEMPSAGLILIEEEDEPWLRFGVHVPYSRKMHKLSNGRELKFSPEFIFVAEAYLQEGLCHSLPPGSFETKECTGTWVDPHPARIHWEYGSFWRGGLASCEPRWNTAKYNLTDYHWRHFGYKHALYYDAVDSLR